MAKKQYQRITAFNAKVESAGPDSSVIIFSGTNSKKTQVVIKVNVDDYFFPYMIKDMTSIARERVRVACQRLESIKDATKPQ